jgi:DNA helicase-4
MLIQFREDWERIVDGRFEQSIDEFLKHRRSLPRESLNREYVKSFGEKIIANTLFEHGVEYKYERNHRWSGINYRPDFTIFGGTKRGVIIEYFGLQGDADYDEMSEKKRAYWNEKPEWEFLEFTPKDIVQHGEEAFVRSLIQKLKEHGCTCERRSEEEIWELVKERAIDDFTKAVMGFISRCRQKNLSSESLGKLIEAHTPCTKAEKLFLQAGQWIYHGYCQHLIANEKEDFDGLMWRAVGRVRDGETLFVRDKGRECGDVGKLRFVMVDEFQDFSEVFYKLISAIQSRNSQVQFFCVGDDWQAINGFAGSDLSYFEDFNDYFENATKHTISTNYRSPSGVVEIGNALMSGRGSLAKSERAELGWVRFCNLSDFSPTPVEEERHSGDEITPAVLRQLRFLLDKGLDVVLLTRRNGVPWYINYESSLKRVNRQLDRFLAHIRSYLPEDDRGRVTISTVHKYKGLEKEAVIVLDASSRSYPLIHVNWIFLRIFGDRIDQIEDDERRLFYVALTRAQDSLAIMASSQDRSPFLDDVRSRMELREIKWQELKPVPSLDSPQLIIKVFDAYKVKDMLKNLHYHYERDEKCWQKGVMEEGFSFDALMSQPWAKQGCRVEVYTETGGLKYKNY